MINKNLKTLKGMLTEDYLERLKTVNLPDFAESIHSYDKSNNLLISAGSKKISAYNIESAKDDIDTRVSTMEFPKSQATVILGIGTGYFIEQAVKKAHEKHKFIIVEPFDGILSYALSNVDLSEYFTNKQIIITPTIQDVSFALETINEVSVVDDWQIIIEKYTMNVNQYRQIAIETVNCLNSIRCNIGTVIGAGKQIADNDIANLPYIIHKRGVNELENIYKDKPAIIVSTGPSLQKNIHHLIDNQDKAIIIAVGQALRPLLSYGIKPDFICSVDFGEVNLTHYEGLMESDVPLVALNRSFAPLLKRWQGPMFVSTSPMIMTHPDHENRIHSILAQKGFTLQGGSVAHMAYGLALLMGCTPIIMIGQDLAYDGDQSHFAQADSRGTLKTNAIGELRWEVKDPRCHLDKQDLSMGMPVPVPGYFLNEVNTNMGLASFINAFENFIKASGALTINSTEGGAHIPGTKRLSLKSALEKYCQNSINKKEKLEPLLSDIDNPMDLIDKAVPLLEEEIKILVKLKNVAKRGIDNNKSLLKNRISNIENPTQKQKDRFNKLLNQNKSLSNKAHQYAVRMPLVQLAIYGANRKIQHHAMMVKGSTEHISTNDADAKTRIERNRIILQSAYESACSLKETYDNVLKQLKLVQEKNDISLLRPAFKEPEPDILDAEKYFAEGNFARPMLEAHKLIKKYPPGSKETREARLVYHQSKNILRSLLEKAKELPDRSTEIEYIDMVHEAHEIGRDKKDFIKAKELLEKAVEIYPDGELGRWGLATVLMHEKQYDESIKHMQNLIERYPKPRYKFELGQTMIMNNDVENGLKQIKDAMIESTEFDSFLCVVGDLFAQQGKEQEAIEAYQKYLNDYPADYKTWEKLMNVAVLVGDDNLKIEAKEKMDKLKI